MSQLNADYETLVERLTHHFPDEAIITDYSRRYAYGTDASFYRMVPEVVVIVSNVAQVQSVLSAANSLSLAVTFRAAGTSLSGQAVSDSVLILLSTDWNFTEPLDNGERVRLAPAVIGEKANQSLSEFGRKIGPDPASIGSCQIGGIVANNASGMCCGTKNNSYHTLDDMVIVFADGTVLDTSEPSSKDAFTKQHPQFVSPTW